MFIVSGANLFGQWFSDKIILEGFERVSKECAETNFELDRAKLVQANWSYNIFDLDGTLFISGSWKRKDNQLIRLPLPEGIDKDASKNLLVAGNDRNIVLVEPEKQIIWILDLKFEKEVQKVIFTSERPQEDTERMTKRTKKINQVLKVVMTNNSCVYLKCVNKTTEVYTGLMPSFFDTDCCMGKVIDVQCGYEHYLLLTDTGKVYTWGNGRRLQLGHGNIDNQDRPREVRALGGINIVKIRAGGWHTAVLSEYGDLYIWGWNNSGQLGLKTRAQRRKEAQEGAVVKKKTHRVPTVVDIYDEELNKITLNVLDMSCGSKHTAILLADYSIWITGSNEYGQLGFPIKDCTHMEHFVKVFQGTKDSYLKCGPWSTVIVK
ncbi:RCC1 domain-containing protein 1 [Epargyreus clarus]|uniref:RCC1 domain-containing protein 1 n=1 Tax=Epargyreus clarus TaxID=520877 RepID=UPI003C2E24B0